MSLHHVTTIASDAQAVVDFHAGFLGLRLVKRTAGAADPRQLHLFFGDGLGAPGTLVTCLIWENAGPGRAGTGAFGEIALAVPAGAVGFWLGRCIEHGVAHQGPTRELDEPVLRLKDPDGLIVKLVATAATPVPSSWSGAPVPAEFAVQGLRAVTLFSEMPGPSVALLHERFGFRPAGTEGAVARLLSPDGRAVDVRDGRGFWTAAAGGGTVDHVALRAASRAGLEAARTALTEDGVEVSEIRDRRYFTSLYLRERGGALMEIATDEPGMTVDEPDGTLGEHLIIPEGHAAKAEDLRVLLPPVARPGERRLRKRDLPFIHTIRVPDETTGETLILLHGTGGNETDLLPLGARIAPGATLLGLRGRSIEEGVNRWFRRVAMKRFDEEDIRTEAAALAHFAREAARGYDLDPGRITWVGYSNGANMVGALALLHPEVVQSAILLRAMAVLGEPPKADLSASSFLIVNGTLDHYNDHGALETLLKSRGAEVEVRPHPTGHGLEPADLSEATRWFAGRPTRRDARTP